MIELLLLPPIAFLLYVGLVAILSGIGRGLAGTQHETSAFKAGTYASGEAHHVSTGAPGYGQFFRVALFFAVLHLGALVLATGGLSPVAGLYLLGLAFALVALLLG